MAYMIHTKYFDSNGNLLKLVKHKHVNSASICCFNNMQMNTYGASSAQISDDETAELHCEFTLSKAGELKTKWFREPGNYYDPIRRSFNSMFTERQLALVPKSAYKAK